MRVSGSSGNFSMRSATSFSVSREAVPLPIATRSTLCVTHRAASAAIDPSQSLRGSCGKMAVVATTAPVLPTTATFTPVRMPGSSPIVTRVPAGAANSRSRRLVPKTRMASSSAISRRRCSMSFSSLGCRRAFHARVTAARRKSSAGRCWWVTPANAAMRCSGSPRVAPFSSSGSTMDSLRMPSLRPRSSASTRWDGSLLTGSRASK